MKPIFSQLRGKWHISSGYIDDSFLLGYSIADCQLNIDDTLHCFHELGFLTHDDKFVTTLTQIIQHLGFVLNSIDMTVSISEAKHNKLCDVASAILKQNKPTIRAVAQTIGMMVACFPTGGPSLQVVFTNFLFLHLILEIKFLLIILQFFYRFYTFLGIFEIIS